MKTAEATFNEVPCPQLFEERNLGLLEPKFRVFFTYNVNYVGSVNFVISFNLFANENDQFRATCWW